MTQSPDRITARFDTLALRLGSLRLDRSHTTLTHDIDFVNSQTRSKLLEISTTLSQAISKGDGEEGLAASILLDACLRRIVYVTSESKEPDWPMAELEQASCHASTVDLYSAFMRIMVSKGASTTGYPLAHLMEKGLPRRSVARMWPTVIFRYMKASKLFERTVFELLKASLIGNYEHSTDHLSFEARCWVHDMFDEEPLPNSKNLELRAFMRENFVLMCSPLFKFAVRDHMIYLLDDEDIARKHFDARYGYANFREHTIQAMKTARIYFEEHTKPGGALTAEHAMPLVGQPMFKKQLNKMFGKIHTRMLAVQVKPIAAPFFQFLGGLRGQVPVRADLVQEQIRYHRRSIESVMADLEMGDGDEDDSDAEEKDEEEEEDSAVHHLNLLKNFDNMKSLDRLMRELNIDLENKFQAKQAEVKKVVQHEIKLTKQGVTARHSKAWAYLISKLQPYTGIDDVFAYVLDMLPYFEVDPAAVAELRDKWRRYQEGGPTHKAWKAEMTLFAARFPTTWSNIVASWIARIEHSNARLYMLDFATFHYQVDAISERFKCGTQAIPDSVASLCLCLACRKIHSLVRTPGTASLKQSYIYGLKDVSVDLFSGKAFCRNSKAFMHMRCQTQGLFRVNLQGNVFEYRGKLYTQCPQQGCGMKFQFNPTHSDFNWRGFSCPDCTLELVRAKMAQLIKEHPFSVDRKFRCYLCDKKLVKAASSFIFAKETIVCGNAKHKHSAMVDYIRSNVPWVARHHCMEDETAAGLVRAAMLAAHKEIKEHWAKHNSAKNDSLLRRIRKNSWVGKTFA